MWWCDNLIISEWKFSPVRDDISVEASPIRNQSRRDGTPLATPVFDHHPLRLSDEREHAFAKWDFPMRRVLRLRSKPLTETCLGSWSHSRLSFHDRLIQGSINRDKEWNLYMSRLLQPGQSLTTSNWFLQAHVPLGRYIGRNFTIRIQSRRDGIP